MEFDLQGRSLLRASALGNVTVAVALFAGLAYAQPRDTLTLERAQALLRQHPSLSALTLEVEARQKLAAQAGALPNPSLSVEAENFAGTGGLSGVQGLETTTRLEQTLEMGGKRSLRRDQAQAETRLAQSERALKEAELSVDLREAFSEALRLQERLRVLSRDTLFLKEVVEVARRRSQAGGGGVAEEGKLRLAFSQARIEVVTVRAELDVALQKLALLMSLPTPDFTAVQGTDVGALPEWSMIQQRLENHPELLRWKSERELRQLSLRSARSQNMPDLGLNAGVRRLNAGGGDWAVVGGVSVPLPVWNRNRGAIAGSESRIRSSEQGAEAARRELTAEAFSLWSSLRVKGQEIERLRSDLLPQAVQVRDDTRAAYAQGRFSVLELLDGQRTWLELNEHYIEQMAEYRLNAAKLDALISASNL